jgi:hypothetical protein
MELAPIVLFVYNRPDHTRQVLEALTENPEAINSRLYIYADGPPAAAMEADIAKIDRVRTVINSKRWCGDVTIIESKVNKGLSKSIIEGVTEVVNRHGKVIVLEDDIVPGPVFLDYMNDGLQKFEDNEKVMSISSYNYFAVSPKIPEVFFLYLNDCWGWATWKRGWKLFESDANRLIHAIESKKLTEQFNFGGAYDYLAMLKGVAAGNVDSWAIRWYASGLIHGKLSLYPKISMVKNIGFDGTGMNSGLTEYTVGNFQFASTNPIVRMTNVQIENSDAATEEFKSYFLRKQKGSMWNRLLSYLGR